MTYDHAVKVNGKWFKAGEDVVASSVLTAETAPVSVDIDTKEKAEEKAEKPAPAKRSYTKRK